MDKKEFTQVRITKAYRDRLKELAYQERRSMAGMLEILIDKAEQETK